MIYQSIDRPVPAANEALIKVKFCGLNHLDLLIQQGKRPGPKIFPHILGSEIVGTTAQGDNVIVYPWTFCGKCFQCKSGNENVCDNGGTIGRTKWGGYAEYTVVPAKNLIKIPKGLSLDQVCAATLAGTTAHHLIDRAKVKNNSSVLVAGSTGGVGTFVIQLLKNRDCKIICSTSHSSKKNLLKKLGVDHVVSTKRLAGEVRRIYPGGVNYVVDMIGGHIWSEGVRLLAKNGTMVYCATTIDETGTVDIGSAFSRQINILGSYGGRIKDLKNVLKLLKNKILQPCIDSIYPLRKAQEALKKLDKQKAFGKILLEI